MLKGIKVPANLREGEVWHITNQANYLVLDGCVCEQEGEQIICSFIVKNGELTEFEYTKEEEPSELYYRVLQQMSYVDGQNNYEVNCLDLTYYDGKIYAEGLCMNQYGGVFSNENEQEIEVDERTLYDIFDLMHGSNFVRIFDPKFFNELY